MAVLVYVAGGFIPLFWRHRVPVMAWAVVTAVAVTGTDRFALSGCGAVDSPAVEAWVWRVAETRR